MKTCLLWYKKQPISLGMLEILYNLFFFSRKFFRVKLSYPMNHYRKGLTSDSDCSRPSSSANSLEWDSVQESIRSYDAVDTDTQLLLNEIDRLTVQALRETGFVGEGDNAVVGYLDDAL